jgi:hypothetical protein
MTGVELTKGITEAIKAGSKPITKLIDCVSKGLGKVYEPIGTVRQAKADAKAALILAEGDAARKELISGAAHRLAFIETRRQEVIESITEQAKALLPETVSEDPVSEDWTVQFFENAKDVTEPELQRLWAAILAREVSTPGSYSRRTLVLLKTFEKAEAQLFTHACSVSLCDKDNARFLFNGKVTDAVFRSQFGIKGDGVNHLISIGLLSAAPVIQPISAFDKTKLEYFGKSYRISAPGPPHGNTIPTGPEPAIGIRSFTSAANELANIVRPTEIPGYLEMLQHEFGVLRVRFYEISDKNP